jgi:hypothetical protein
LIQSIEVTRPAPAELTVLAAPGVERERPASEPPPDCDPAPRELLRAGCPATPPVTSACTDEGLECRYANGDGCAELHECVHGWWTHVPADCSQSEAGAVLLSGSGPCEDRLPIADTPCAEEGVACGYLPCAIGGGPELEVECRCGRWYLRWNSCPID